MECLKVAPPAVWLQSFDAETALQCPWCGAHAPAAAQLEQLQRELQEEGGGTPLRSLAACSEACRAAAEAAGRFALDPPPDASPEHPSAIWWQLVDASPEPDVLVLAARLVVAQALATDASTLGPDAGACCHLRGPCPRGGGADAWQGLLRCRSWRGRG